MKIRQAKKIAAQEWRRLHSIVGTERWQDEWMRPRHKWDTINQAARRLGFVFWMMMILESS